jgi:hypothetical protein
MLKKLQIKGLHVSYSILEIKQSDALFLQNIMERELISYSQIFFERRAYKKLGYKSLEDLPVKLSISGFLTESDDSIQVPCLKFFRNDKMVFKCAINRLEHKYHMSLFKEHDLISSYLAVNEFQFRKRNGYHYFFLKKEQKGEFKFALENDVELSDILFKHTKHHFNKNIHEPIMLLNLMENDLELIHKKKQLKSEHHSICAVK